MPFCIRVQYKHGRHRYVETWGFSLAKVSFEWPWIGLSHLKHAQDGRKRHCSSKEANHPLYI